MTLQAGSDKHGSVTGSGPLPAITAGQATHNGLCRPLPGGLHPGGCRDRVHRRGRLAVAVPRYLL